MKMTARTSSAALRAVVLVLVLGCAEGSNNGAARTPPMGFNQWNDRHNNFNTSVFLVSTVPQDNNTMYTSDQASDHRTRP